MDPSVFAIPLHSVALLHIDNNATCKHVYVRVRYENPRHPAAQPSVIRARRATIPGCEYLKTNSPRLVDKALISKVSASPRDDRNDHLLTRYRRARLDPVSP